MTTGTTYRIADAPKFAGLKEWDCTRCDHEGLRRPVFLTNGSGVVAVGTGCAASLLGITVRNAEREAARAAIEGREDMDGTKVRSIVSTLRAWKPGRITNRLVADLASRHWVTESLAREAAYLWQAAYGR